jgi:hypothetical protein
MTAQILPIPLDMLDDYWPHVWPHLAKGVEVSGRTRAELAADILHDRARVWFAATDGGRRVSAAWLTEVLSDDGRRVLNVYGMGGERPADWVQEFADEMERYARAEGCAAARYAGREGWARYRPEYRKIGNVGGEAIFERALQ